MRARLIGITGQDDQTISFTHNGAVNLALAHQLTLDVVRPFLYRPFDTRFIVYDKNVVTRPRSEVMPHLILGQNIGIITTRQTRDTWDVFVTSNVCGHKTCAAYDINYVFPLYLYPNTQTSLLTSNREPNLNPLFITDVQNILNLQFIADGCGDLQTTIGPEDIFHYAYAVFRSPAYRQRYIEFLKTDFPRLSLTSNRILFASLVKYGAALVDLHLLRLPGALGVGGAGGAAILTSPGKQGVRFPMIGTNVVDKIQYVGPLDEAPGYVTINSTQRFVGIDPQTWEMQIGGYQPLEKWLKDRKGRMLTHDDIQHYLRIIIALRETHRIMGEIDALIPGWPLP